MIEVYYYVPAGAAGELVECGLKLSAWFNKEVVINGDMKKCISALLNPKDDMTKYRSDLYSCVKLEVEPRHCYVADRALYEAGLKHDDVMNMYTGSIISIENYLFGSYRSPECLITGTVIAGHISILNKKLDSPILFDNSEELYINNIMETYRENNESFNDTLMYYFYCKLAEIRKVDKIEDMESKTAVFFDNSREKVVTIKIPDISKY